MIEIIKEMKNKHKENNMNKIYDPWEFPESCKKCKQCDNQDKQQPITYLDVETMLCESCFMNEYPEIE
jgi:hypothetical protein